MDELPPNASRKLPGHNSGTNPITTKPGDEIAEKLCPGTEVEKVYSDVGLLNGSCPKCKSSFVYIPKKDAWILEEEFEEMLKG